MIRALLDWLVDVVERSSVDWGGFLTTPPRGGGPLLDDELAARREMTRPRSVPGDPLSRCMPGGRRPWGEREGLQ